MKSTRGLTRVFAWPVQIYYEDTDAAGVVYYANYLKYFERCRSEWLRSLGYNQQRLSEVDGIGFAVRRISVDYLAPARMEDSLSVEAAISGFSRARLRLHQRACRRETVLARADVEVVCLKLERFRPTSLPASLYAQLEGLEESP